MSIVIKQTRRMLTYLYQMYSSCRTWIRSLFVQHYVVSYPKSGRTWLRYFLASFCNEKYAVPLTLDFDHIFRNAQHVPRITFTHTQYYSTDFGVVMAEIKKLQNKKVLFLVRDPRDVIVSWYFHQKKRKKKERLQSDSLSDFVRNEEYGIPRIVTFYNHMDSVKRLFDEYEVISYEDMHEYPKKTFSAILRFIGEQDSEERLLNVALGKSSFTNMQKVEVENQTNDSRLKSDAHSDIDARKVRRGKIGGYTDYFTEDDAVFAQEELAKLSDTFNAYKK